MKVRDWMTRDVLCVSPSATAREAFERMAEAGTRHVLVQGQEDLVGMVSNRDLVRVTFQNSGQVLDLDGCTAADIMTPSPLLAIGPDDSLADAARLLDEHQISALPVLEEGNVVGVLTTSDLLRTFWQGQEAPLES